MTYTVKYEPVDNESRERTVRIKASDDVDILRRVALNVLNIQDDPEIRPSTVLSKEYVEDNAGKMSERELRKIFDSQDSGYYMVYAYVNSIIDSNGEVIYE